MYNLVSSRRDFLYGLSASLGAVALSDLIAADTKAPFAIKEPMHPPRAKACIMLFMEGGPAHMDTFDPKPQLQKDHGKPLPIDRPRLLFHSTGESNNKLFVSHTSFTRSAEIRLLTSSLSVAFHMTWQSLFTDAT